MSCFVDMTEGISHDIAYLECLVPSHRLCQIWVLPNLEEALSQHQQVFLADNTGEVARVAHRVLSMLASGELGAPENGAVRAPLPTSLSLIDLAERLYTASICSDRANFEGALCDVQRAGYSHDTVAFELIPSIARRLGADWEDDLISFIDVTIGCARLQSALRCLPDEMKGGSIAYNGTRRNCLVMVPMGAQHTMGALVLAKHLRHAWQQVVVELEVNEGKLSSLAQKQNFNVVLISASRGECLQNLRHLVCVTRRHWAASKVVVGGSISDLGSDLTSAIGADHVTMDWQEALDLCI